VREDCPAALPGPVIWDTEPTWEPLLDVVGPELTGTFMWMHQQWLPGDTLVHAYKHCETRRYLYLAEGRRAFVRAPCGALAPLRLDFALQRALSTWWMLGGFDRRTARAVQEVITNADTSAYDEGFPG